MISMIGVQPHRVRAMADGQRRASGAVFVADACLADTAAARGQLLNTMAVCFYHAAGRRFWNSGPHLAPVALVIGRLRVSGRGRRSSDLQRYVTSRGDTAPYLRVRDCGPFLWSAPPVVVLSLTVARGPRTDRSRFFRRVSEPRALLDRYDAQRCCYVAARRHMPTIAKILREIARV
ncbi:MAG: hypothetical protein ABJI96_23470 [Paracoccaceae bacterium]